MSKIFLIGDTHIGLGYPNNVDKWFKIHQEYFSDFLIPLLKDKVKSGDIIVHLGDLFDNRNIIPINLLNYGMDIIEEISKIAPIHIIVGNHDLWSKSASEINSVRPFKYIPNVKIYNYPEILEFNNLKILMMPFIEKKSEQIKIINEYQNCDYLFCHSDLNGCKMHLTSVAHKNNDQMDRNDMGDQKGIFVIDTLDDSEEFYPNNISPRFKKLEILTEEDVDKLDTLNTKDYIDLYISNTLLIGNRKLRRKLEIILEKGSFASVEYIDDIKDENKKPENSVADILDENGELRISVNLEFEEYIREYIKAQNWDSDKIKLGILSEYEEIVQTYRQNYKSKID